MEQTELTSVLESLVNDNETLKRDNAELQNMLTESREEIHTLQEEVEEHRAQPPSRSGGERTALCFICCFYIIATAGTPYLRTHTYVGSVPASAGKDHSVSWSLFYNST